MRFSARHFAIGALASAALAGVLSGGDKLDEAKYRLSGRVNLRQGLLRSIPFEKEGSFRLR